MGEKIRIELGSVQKTLFMPVWARAVETKKTEPILVDETAIEIIEKIDYDFDSLAKNINELSQISWVARCKKYDEIINYYIENNPDGTIVNIGCGLDTTYERIKNDTIIWYDLDLPDVIELRKKFIIETDKRQFISYSFLDSKWFDKIINKGTVLMVSAGVFSYFEESEIRDFIKKVIDVFPHAELLFDVTSSHGIRAANRIIKDTGLGEKSFMKWALKDKSVITSWDNHIEIINTCYTYKLKGLKLSLKNKLLGIISDWLQIQYILHLRIKS